MKFKRIIKKNNLFDLVLPDENEMINIIMPNTEIEHTKDDKDEEKSDEF